MIRLILLVAALIAGIVLGPHLANNQGYVLISFSQHTLEMSLTTLIVLTIVAFMGILLLENIIKFILSRFSVTMGWFAGRKARKARQLTALSQTKLLEGDWSQAEKLALKGATHNAESPQLNYLMAAEAAQGLGDIAKRDKHLALAEKQTKSDLAVRLTRARLQFDNKQFEEALATLQQLQSQYGNNPVVLSLLRDCYLQLNDWQPLIKLLPTLKKQNLISEKEYSELNIKAEIGVMAQITQVRGCEGLLSHWHSLNKRARQNPALLAAFVEQMISRQADNQAYSIIKESLKKEVAPEVVALIPQLNLSDYHPVVTKLTSLLKYNENNAVLHSTLGQLYLREEKFAEAQAEFEKAVALSPNVSDYAYLANMLERQQKSEQAAEATKLGLNLALPEQKSA
ncbi:heme biosynthesis HemY N-terminal domain-containing protein [Thaumasiovibrio subtropicus]|uniref:heme biosynthesis HemY N-terminal domain-containing protein n=1 Tax=Thaumasiovibrio subtropicus TaxID=1891207 RepID=UPI000B361BE8|nr:heme biosynthesis HemY N-terminal domain-containing protein [Thaumasiovibrio subtropicus]